MAIQKCSESMSPSCQQSSVLNQDQIKLPPKTRQAFRARTSFLSLGMVQCISSVLLMIMACVSLSYWSTDLHLSNTRATAHSMVIVLSVVGLTASGLGFAMAFSKKKLNTCMSLSYLTLTMMETLGFFAVLVASICEATEVPGILKKIKNYRKHNYRYNDYFESHNAAIIIDIILIIFIFVHAICAIVSMTLTCYNISSKSKILPAETTPQQCGLVQLQPMGAHPVPTAPPISDATVISETSLHTGPPLLYPQLDIPFNQEYEEPKPKF